MKKTVPLKKTFLPAGILTRLAACGLVLISHCPAYASGICPADAAEIHYPASGVPSAGRLSPLFLPGLPGYDTIHSIVVNKSQVSKKNKIRLYPDARQQVLFFSANGEDGKVYQLYLFDMDGRLVNQTRIRNRETTVLTNMSEGNFLFEVFTDDERIENGSLTIK